MDPIEKFKEERAAKLEEQRKSFDQAKSKIDNKSTLGKLKGWY